MSFLSLHSLVNKNEKYRVGDVKYSILSPEKFYEENTDDWVLLDGRNIEKTRLHTVLGLQSIPDARGMFLRGDNFKRDDGNQDPQENRRIGSYQPDGIVAHSHKITLNPTHASLSDYSNRRIGGTGNSGTIPEGDTQDFGTQETRPKNINLFIYIKVR